jgi:two-component system, chemotaxis family, CheB/CheR fusion protein
LIDTSRAEFHRHLRNLYAVLRVMVRRTSGTHQTVEDYAAHLEGRIGALARADEMLMRAPETGVDLQDLICGELLAQAFPASQYTVDGPDVRLTHASTTPLALTLHELATNALVHGAFGNSQGHVSITWKIEERSGGTFLRLTWLESGVAVDAGAPLTKGFGSEIVERTLPYELNAEASLRLTPTGAEAVLLIPSDAAAPNWRPGDGPMNSM